MNQKFDQGRPREILDTYVRYTCVRYGDRGVMTRREFCRKMKKLGAKIECAQVPSVRYNRRKLNNMDYRESMAYEKKLATLKAEYRIYYPGEGGGFVVITKTEYEFFLSDECKAN